VEEHFDNISPCIETTRTPILVPSTNSASLPAQPIHPTRTERLDVPEGPPPLDVVLESFKNSITQQWESLVNSYFPNQSPANALYARSHTTATPTPTLRTPPAQSLATKTQQVKRRYADFQEVVQTNTYSEPSKRRSAVPTHSTGDERRLRLKSPLNTPSLWAVPEIRPVGRPRGPASAKSRSRPTPFHNPPKVRTQTSSLCRKSPSIGDGGDEIEDELAVGDLIGLHSAEMKQKSGYSRTSQEEMEWPRHGVQIPINDGDHALDGIASTIRHSSEDAFPSALDDPNDRGVYNDDIDHFGSPEPSPAPSEAYLATKLAVENVFQDDQSQVILTRPLATPQKDTRSTPLSRGGHIQKRVDSSRKSTESRASGSRLVSQPRQQSIGSIEEPAVTPTKLLERATTMESLSSSGSRERRKKDRTLFIQGSSLPRPGLLKVHPTVAESVAAAAGRINPYQVASKPAFNNQAAHHESALNLPPIEHQLPDPGIHHMEDDQIPRTKHRGRPRKSDSRLDPLMGEHAPQPRPRGRPRKSDPGPTTALQDSPREPSTATDRQTRRSRHLESGQRSETKEITISQPRTIGRPYTSPWDLEDDKRLVDVITVQNFSFQKAYDCNLFPGKTIPALVHRYYRVLGGPLKQVKEWSNSPRECENCHIEYRPGKRVNLSVDALCVVCSLYRKAHGGTQRPLGSDGLSTTPNGLSSCRETNSSSPSTTLV
jgi:hypothetical protein